MGYLSLTLFWVWLLPLWCSCLVSLFHYSWLFLADHCCSCYPCCTLSSSVDAALQGYDSCCQLFLVWKGCHTFCFDLTILRSTLVFNRLYFLLHLGYNDFSHHGRTISYFQPHYEDVSWEPCIIYQYSMLINELSWFLVFLYIFVVQVEDDDMFLSEEWLVWCFWKSQTLPSTASVETLYEWN